MPEARFYSVDVVFTVARRVPLRVWSGAVAGKLVYDALSLAGSPLPEGGVFRVSPLYPVEGGVPVSGFLAPGERYRLRAVFWGSPGAAPGHVLARSFLAGVGMLGWLRVEEAGVREERVALPEPGLGEGGCGDPVAAEVSVRHGPTFYRFHGSLVSYPSPWRLVASVARRLSVATGVEYRGLASRLQRCLELAVDNTKKTRVRLTHGKEVKVFVGEARYHVVCCRCLVEAAMSLLSAARLTGAGGSPGLGLGEIHGVEWGRPRHRLPAPVEPWAEEPEEPPPGYNA